MWPLVYRRRCSKPRGYHGPEFRVDGSPHGAWDGVLAGGGFKFFPRRRALIARRAEGGAGEGCVWKVTRDVEFMIEVAVTAATPPSP